MCKVQFVVMVVVVVVEPDSLEIQMGWKYWRNLVSNIHQVCTGLQFVMVVVFGLELDSLETKIGWKLWRGLVSNIQQVCAGLQLTPRVCVLRIQMQVP